MSSISPQLKPFLAGKKIIVAGAGIAGLSFVIALRKLWPASISGTGLEAESPAVVVYERSSKELAIGREGYSLSIRSDRGSGGMQALQKLGILDKMLRVSLTGPEGETGGFAIWDLSWKEIMKVKATGSSVPELPVPSMRIARRELRRVLVDAVPSSDIHWSTSCTGAVQLGNGRIQVQLSNGEVDECDLLVAADGANSKLRASLRPDDKLSFAGAVCITGDAKFPDGIPEPVDEDWGTVLGAGGTGLFVSPIDKHSAVWSLSYMAPEPRESTKRPLPEDQAHLLLEEALQRGKSFSEPFRTLVQATDLSTLTTFNAMDKLPFPHVSGGQDMVPIVYIGDSNHAISPFAGNGANMALMDGWDLAEQLCKPVSLPAAIGSYDSLSIPRSKSAIQMSHWSISLSHAQGWQLTLYVFLLRLIKLFFL